MITHIQIFLCMVKFWYFHNLGWPLQKLKIVYTRIKRNCFFYQKAYPSPLNKFIKQTYIFNNINLKIFSDKQQEVDINNLRLSEEDPSVRAKTRAKGGACTASVPPLSQISGVKKPLTHTHSVTGGSSLPEHGVHSKNPQQLAKVFIF